MPVPFTILYEDDALLFVDKAAGIVVQRGYDLEEPVLIEQVQQYVTEKNETAFLLQRLDRGTSGVIFFSKRSDFNARLTRQFEKKVIRKSYVALCHGRLEVRQRIDAPLLRIGPISFGVRGGGRRAETVVHPLSWNNSASLVALDLLTGRTHQIRAHMAAIHHPLLGDWLYGARDAERPMLHALRVSMLHPGSGLPFSVSARPAADFLTLAEENGLHPPPELLATSGGEDRVEPGQVTTND